MVLIAGAIASLAALTVGQASASTPQTVEIVGQEDLGAPSGEVFYFKQGRVSVHKEGGSLVVAGKGEVFSDTLGGLIGDSVSAVITAPEGTTLSYVCAIHPWMQGEIEVLNRFER